MTRFILGLVVLAFADDDAQNRLARDIYKELIEINTADSTGDTTKAAQAMAARLKAAGFPEADIRVLGREVNRETDVAAFDFDIAHESE